eukprot:scaffold2368_cov248-Pinguiococcus_pyrenoidosus.AAC.4
MLLPSRTSILPRWPGTSRLRHQSEVWTCLLVAEATGIRAFASGGRPAQHSAESAGVSRRRGSEANLGSPPPPPPWPSARRLGVPAGPLRLASRGRSRWACS